MREWAIMAAHVCVTIDHHESSWNNCTGVIDEIDLRMEALTLTRRASQGPG